MSLKRLLLLAAVVMLPAQVYAAVWSLSYKVMTSGGSMQVGGGTPISSIDGPGYGNYTTTQNLPVRFLPASGYQVSAYSVNGTSQPLPPPDPVNMGLLVYPGKTYQSISVSFAKPSGKITATALSGGIVSPTGTMAAPVGSTAVYTFVPNSGLKVVSISGLPTGAVLTSYGTPVTLPYAGPVTVTFPVTSTPVNMVGAFVGLVADTGAPQTVINGNRANLSAAVTIYDGSPISSLLYSWTQVSGPTQPLSAANTATPYFVATTPGSYIYQVLVMDGLGASTTAYANVAVAASATDVARDQCMPCHLQSGVGIADHVFNKWSSSGHRANNVLCFQCHTGANTAAHPGPITSSTVDPVTFLMNGTNTVVCIQCHSASIPAEFATARHASVIYCSSCHIDPHTAAAFSSVTFRTFSGGSFQGRVLCFRCHGGVNSTHYYTKAIVNNICSSCHASTSHNPAPTMKPLVGTRHFNGYTSYVNPGYNAAYVNPRTTCTSCHVDTTGFDLHSTQRKQWAGSAHGDTTAPAWKNAPGRVWIQSNGCVRCHSAEGFSRFLSSGYTQDAPLTDFSDNASGPLTCNGCHTPTFQVKQVPPPTIFYNITTGSGKLVVSHPYPDTNKSNICIACHSGNQSGETVAALAAAFGNLSGYNGNAVSTHGLPVALTLYANGYTSAPFNQPLLAHDQIGIANNGTNTGDSGPCASCHMTNKDHSFEAVTKDDTGAIRSINNQGLCVQCHTVMDAPTISAAKNNFYNSLAMLAQLLINKGYLASYSYGGRIAAPNLAGAWGSSAKFGAWYNLDLITRNDSQANDPGAYVHNPAYARKLIYDAIDIFDDGIANNSVAATLSALRLDPTKITGLPAGLTPDAVQASGNGYVKTDEAGCAVCHSNSIDPRSGHNILADYAASAHPKAANGPTCANCHAPNPPVPHPSQPMNTATDAVSARCYGCHGDPLTYKIPHTWVAIGLCSTCHNGHYPKNITMKGVHFGSFTTAQYVTANFTCTNCHYAVDQQGNSTFNVYSANYQWARQGKGNPASPSWTAFDFKTRGTAAPATPATSAGDDCVRCHTSTGYINYVTSNFQSIQPWGIGGDQPGGDRTREMVMCAACHNPTPFRSYETIDPDTGDTIPPYTRREVPQVTAYYNYSSQGSSRILNKVTLNDSVTSNLCIVCHSGRVAGSTLKKISTKLGPAATFWSNTPFIDSHTMGAAGILFGKTGYTFGRSYTASPAFAHPYLDLDDQGPCIACHMYTNKKHLFSPVSSASNGTITKIRAYDEVCSSCHAGSTGTTVDLSNPANLDAKKQGLASSLKALSAVFASKGILFDSTRAPYFFQAGAPGTPYTNWNAFKAPSLYNGADVMGAAFNLKLLSSDKGSYAHNDYYTKRLIYDSIDFLDNGTLDDTVYLTIQNLQVTDTLTQDDKTRALAYVGARP